MNPLKKKKKICEERNQLNPVRVSINKQQDYNIFQQPTSTTSKIQLNYLQIQS